MLRIQLINAWRNLKNNKLISFINIAGLTIGLSCAIMAILFAYHELTYESSHEKADRISRVYTLGKFGSMEKIPVTWCPVGNVLQSNYPEIDLAARSRSISGIVFKDNVTPISEDNIVVSDLSIFSIFTIPFEAGGMPSGPGQIALSEKTAMKYFRENAVGNSITINIYGQKRDFIVAGIFKDFPSNTHLKASIIIPFAMADQLGWNPDQYNGTDYAIYTLTQRGADLRSLNNKIAETYKIPVDVENVAIALVPVKRIHLHDNITQNAKANLMILLTGGILALILSCFNYINLSNILFSSRTKEVGINKTMGAGKLEVFQQFMTHTFLTSFISFGLAFLIIILLLPSFNSLFDVKLESIFNLKTTFFVVALFIITFLLSGFYPAFIQSGFKPLLLIKNDVYRKKGGNKLMNVLITVQFVVSVMLLQFMIISLKQGNHLTKYDVSGFSGHNVLCINGNAWGDLNKVKDELLKNPKIEKVSWGSRLPRVGMGMIQEWKEEGNKEMALRFWMESDYLETFKIKLLKGRTFSEGSSKESLEVIINKLTANSLELDDPVGKEMMIGGKQYRIIGVTENFQAVPPIFNDMPIIILKSGSTSEYLLARINPSDQSETQSYIRETLSKINPDFPIEITFYEDHMATLAKS